MKKKYRGVVAALIVILSLLVLTPAALAYDQAQARAAAGVWIHNHCGDIGYRCDWWVINSVVPTGINQTGRAQWKFSGQGAETRTDNNPFEPKYLSCTFGGGVGPEGGIYNAFKICSPEG